MLRHFGNLFLQKTKVFARKEVNRAAKTSNSTPKCIWILEWGSEESAASGG